MKTMMRRLYNGDTVHVMLFGFCRDGLAETNKHRFFFVFV